MGALPPDPQGYLEEDEMMTPHSEAELADIIAGANGPLCIEGGGTRGIEVPGERLSTGGLSGVTLYEPGALTLVVQALSLIHI